MTGIIDYARDEARPFTELAFNEVDALVLATLIYEDVANICPTLMLDESRSGSFSARIRAFRPKHPLIWLKGIWHPALESVSLAEANQELHRSLDTAADDKPHEAQVVSVIDPGLTHTLFEAAGNSPRFSGVRLGAVLEHVNRGEQTQFAAATFQLPDGRNRRNPSYKGTLVISFRGTDDSLIGWKEDFNMAFQYPVPAQRAASAYLDTVARLWAGPIILVGHSKGGNLAIYAAMNAEPAVRRRIQHVYSLDGPGFPPEIVTSQAYRSIEPKITKIVPDSSIVGMIFETPEPCRIIASDSDGLMQHSAYTWQLEGDAFVTEPDLSSRSQLFNEELNHWVAALTPEQRERAVDALFTVLHANGAASIRDVMNSLPASIPSMLGAYVGLTPEDRHHLAEVLGILFRASAAKRKQSPNHPGPGKPAEPQQPL
jgi:predicted alpha/beta hydrolase family esterase